LEGDAFVALYAICSGSIKTVTRGTRAVPQAIGFFIPGELVGIAGLVARRHTAEAVALEPTEVTEIPFSSVAEATDSHPPLRRIVFQVFAEQLAHDEALLLPLVGRKSATERLAAYLVALGQRYAARGFSNTDFPLSMSRNDLSNHLGLAKETVCRLLARLSEEGLISLESRRVRIHDLARLSQLAGERHAA
jgi:CRP/FNR family transcriptional regulator